MINLLTETGLNCPVPNFYQLLTVQNARKDEETILKALGAIRSGKRPNDLLLLNYYNDLPISFGASIEYIDRGIVVLMVHSFQAAAMLMQEMTFIKSDLLPHWVMANVLKVDRENNLAFLALFSYVHNPSERRMHVRITLPEMVEASFHNRKLQVPGSVQDISFSGVALLSPEETPFREMEKGMVSLILPSSKLDVPGTFIKCQEQQSIHRHIFRLDMNARCERILSQYIYQQQSRIMDELKNISPDSKEEWRL
jgi:hypothetical protein